MIIYILLKTYSIFRHKKKIDLLSECLHEYINMTNQYINSQFQQLINQHLTQEDTNTNTSLEELITALSSTKIQKQYSLNETGVQRVVSILDDRKASQFHEFLVQWEKGEPTWEPMENISRYCLQLYYYQKEVDTVNKMIPATDKWAHIYLRTSTPKRDVGQVSLHVQKQDMITHCIKNNIKIASITFDEGTSAKDMTRLEGLNMIMEKIVPGQVLMVWDISRFSRNSLQAMTLLQQLEARNIGVFFFKENLSYQNAREKHHVRMFLSGAQYLSESISEKVKRVNEYKKAQGNSIGHPKFGFKAVRDQHGIRKFIPCQKEQKQIKLIQNMIQELQNQGHTKLGIKDFRLVANFLNQKRIRYRGKQFKPSSIGYIMKNNKT